MPVPAGHHRLGPDRGRILLHTFRDGVAARAGHDLTIEVARWSGELTTTAESEPAGLDVRIDMTSLTVLEGHGGISPLSDRDRREIAVTARKVLGADRYPEARFQADTFQAGTGGGVISGTLTLHGVARPLRLQVREDGAGRYHASGSVTQSEYGIKPYAGFLGALRVRDAVDMDVDIDLEKPGDPGGER
jgi:polyisoprenoid-binding protein YceI